jgi:predicted metal-dependent phosphoesterase TrpH
MSDLGRCFRPNTILPIAYSFPALIQMIIDIHTHTYPTSDDSILTPEELITKAKRIGLDGVCITDHDRFWDPKDIRALSRKYDYLVLPGCEVTTEEGHMLVYGLQEYIFGMHKASYVRELVDDAGGAMVVAHPYRRFYRKQAHTSEEAYREMLDRACRNKVFGFIDAVEIFNGRGSDEENHFASDIAERFGLSATGASDAHNLEQIGTYATRFQESVRDLDDFITELKAGRFSPYSLRNPVPALVRA